MRQPTREYQTDSPSYDSSLSEFGPRFPEERWDGERSQRQKLSEGQNPTEAVLTGPTITGWAGPRWPRMRPSWEAHVHRLRLSAWASRDLPLRCQVAVRPTLLGHSAGTTSPPLRVLSAVKVWAEVLVFKKRTLPSPMAAFAPSMWKLP